MATIYTFDVTLLDIRPRVWRRFTLRNTATFLDLHDAIQRACGWENCHLFRFHHDSRKGVVFAGIPDDSGFEEPDPDADNITLKRYFGDKPGRCAYQYDFGDDWWHDVVVTEVSDSTSRATRTLLDGARAFPREDCGGVYGYERCVAAATGKWKREFGDARELREQLAWLDGWTPERFDLAAVKAEFDR